MARDKKQDETLVMRYFREKYPAFPAGKLIPSESPDFILKTGRHRDTGIEITQIISPATGFQNKQQIIEELEKIIRKKNDKLLLYRRNNFNETWLIIACDDLNLPGHNQLDDVLSGPNFTNGFDKVFLFDLFSGEVREVGRMGSDGG